MTDIEIRVVVEQTINTIVESANSFKPIKHLKGLTIKDAIDNITNDIIKSNLVSKCDPKDIDLTQLKYSYAKLRQFAWLAFVNHKCDQFGKISMRDVKQSVESYNAWFNKNIKEI